MSHTTITIRPSAKGKKVLVELDAQQFELLASNLGFFSPDFLKSLDRAEKDYKAGRIYEIASLREWRNKK